MKKLLSLVLSFLLIASLCPALADTPPADQIAASGESYVEWYNRTRANDDLIAYVKSGINAGTGYVIIMAKTETYNIVDTIGVIYSIQRWENSQWNSYDKISCTLYDECEFSDIRTVTVDSGYYYRLVTLHKALNGSESDFVGITTSSIYVN